MTIWLDAQLSPKLSSWIQQEFQISSFRLRELKLVSKTDQEIFLATRNQIEIVIMTKDGDFIDLLNRYGPPPKIIWIRSGNTANQSMQILLKKTLNKALTILSAGDKIVEIAD
ncbi:DUF5615 family PIN-like protein [Leptospira sp. 201903071]|uniref:DUF5615 family PIN-like protein n=1 Tax=Leptospira ainazelensis TaxID=2810034 RepID=UPI001964797C|nr:DUF5615 family PIN-like protein [Leptospira ainazelensis]MBM9500634.1 DUF5615 family PIN-like protein [Leptospira ainazelensis]